MSRWFGLYLLCCSALSLAQDIEVKGFQALALKPETAQEHFLLANFTVTEEARGSKLALYIRTEKDGKTFSVPSRSDAHRDSEGRWVSYQEAQPGPLGYLVKVPFEELALDLGPNKIQYELFWVKADGSFVSLAQSDVYTIYFGLQGYRLAAAPEAPALVVPKPVVTTDPARRKFVVGPYSSWETDTEKVIYFATNHSAHRSGAVHPNWHRFKSIHRETPEKKTFLGAARVRVPLNREPGELIPESESPKVPKEKTVGIVNAIEFFQVARERSKENDWNYEMTDTQADRDSFFKELEGKPVLVYVHGYNNTFETALQRAAQVKADLKWKGAVIAYAWPSLGEVPRYLNDLSNVRDSSQVLADFLVELRNKLGKQPISILAHSMGNYLFLRAMDRVNFTRPIFQRVVLAAPDVSKTDFKKMAPRVVKASEKVTYYFSENDTAVLISKTIRAGFDRAGRDKTPVEGIVTIDATPVTRFNDGFGHNYFGTVKAALADISYFLVDGFAPEQRHRASLLPASDGVGWQLIAP